jgi:tetratricopeptide (TPR) repeat protein
VINWKNRGRLMNISEQSEKAKLYNDKGLILAGMGEWKNSLKSYEIALNIYKEIENHYMIINVRLNMATAFRNLGMFSEAADIYQHDLINIPPISVVEKSDWAKAQNDFGVNLAHLKEWTAANSAFDRAYDVFLELQDNLGIANVWQNKGNLSLWKGEPEIAFSDLETARRLFENQNNQLGLAEVMASLGLVCKKQGRFSEASEYFEKANAVFRNLGHLDNLAKGYGNIGSLLEQEGNYRKAIEFLEKARELFLQLGNNYSAALVTANMGKAWINLDINRSNQYLRDAISTFRQLGADQDASNVTNWLIRNMT